MAKGGSKKQMVSRPSAQRIQGRHYHTAVEEANGFQERYGRLDKAINFLPSHNLGAEGFDITDEGNMMVAFYYKGLPAPVLYPADKYRSICERLVKNPTKVSLPAKHKIGFRIEEYYSKLRSMTQGQNPIIPYEDNDKRTFEFLHSTLTHACPYMEEAETLATYMAYQLLMGNMENDDANGVMAVQGELIDHGLTNYYQKDTMVRAGNLTEVKKGDVEQIKKLLTLFAMLGQ